MRKLYPIVFYRPQTKLQKGNVFGSMCQEFCPQGVCIPAWTGQTPLGRYTLPSQSHPPGRYPQGSYTPLGRYSPWACMTALARYTPMTVTDCVNSIISYHPQQSCGKVMFLNLSVILSTGGCLPQCTLGYTMPLARHPPGQSHPLAGTPPGRYTPLAGTPPWGGTTPPGRYTPHNSHCSRWYASYWDAFLWSKGMERVISITFFQNLQLHLKTRMHSSRMRTSRLLTVCRSLLWGGGLLPGSLLLGGSAPGGVCSCGGLFPGECLLLGGLPQTCPPCEQNHRHE